MPGNICSCNLRVYWCIPNSKCLDYRDSHLDLEAIVNKLTNIKGLLKKKYEAFRENLRYGSDTNKAFAKQMEDYSDSMTERLERGFIIRFQPDEHEIQWDLSSDTIILATEAVDGIPEPFAAFQYISSIELTTVMSAIDSHSWDQGHDVKRNIWVPLNKPNRFKGYLKKTKTVSLFDAWK